LARHFGRKPSSQVHYLASVESLKNTVGGYCSQKSHNNLQLGLELGIGRWPLISRKIIGALRLPIVLANFGSNWQGFGAFSGPPSGTGEDCNRLKPLFA
jgi:hypothetical protein